VTIFKLRYGQTSASSDIASNHPPPSSVENFSPACHDTSSTADETLARSPDLHSPSPNTDSSPLPPHEDVQPLRRSIRSRKPPDWFGDWSTLFWSGWECDGFVARDRLHRLLIDWFVACSPHCIARFAHCVESVCYCQTMWSYRLGGFCAYCLT